jgi:ABC-type nitrate/sulfonate/bicarbonate transport system ATPase subunit
MSARPGEIKAVIAIDLPRPRSVMTLQHPQFHALELQIWSLLRPESVYADASLQSS